MSKIKKGSRVLYYCYTYEKYVIGTISACNVSDAKKWGKSPGPWHEINGVLTRPASDLSLADGK